jgi:hypothetical protein
VKGGWREEAKGGGREKVKGGEGGEEAKGVDIHFVSLHRDHLNKAHSNSTVTEKSLELPPQRPSGARTKAGYMWYAEPKTFGIHWIRLYFHITNGMLLSEVSEYVWARPSTVDPAILKE